jgi:hypothetical protein
VKSTKVYEREIQISGLDCYDENEWRNAILHYLFGVWKNDEVIMSRPKINFGPFTLRLDPQRGQYYAYLTGSSDQGDPFPEGVVNSHNILEVESPDQNTVEIALVRFVKDKGLRALQIDIPRTWTTIWFWKGERRGQLGITITHVPTMEETLVTERSPMNLAPGHDLHQEFMSIPMWKVTPEQEARKQELEIELHKRDAELDSIPIGTPLSPLLCEYFGIDMTYSTGDTAGECPSHW